MYIKKNHRMSVFRGGAFCLLIICLVFLACENSAEEAQANRGTLDDDDDQGDDDFDDGDDEFEKYCGYMNELKSEASNIEIFYNPNADVKCLWDPRPGSAPNSECACIQDYENILYLEEAQPFVNVMQPEELLEIVNDPEYELGIEEEYLSPDDLSEALMDGGNISFLTDGMYDRELNVTVLDQKVEASFCRQLLLFEDPFVGAFTAMHISPINPMAETDGSFQVPTVIASHGHCENPERFEIDHYGERYPDHGLGIIMHSSKGICVDDYEADTSFNLVSNGFSTLGIKVYEEALLLRYLKANLGVDEGHIGLIGHSAGASLGNITSRIFYDDFAAYVADTETSYVAWLPWGAGLEGFCYVMTLGIYPYHVQIYDFENNAVPTIMIPYDGGDRPDNEQRIFEFFEEKLF
ncbi:MAG: hypothetical protein P9M14_13125 [Candidatus Alcyoniella australis]|nr:hypothetical protein [Candidatus Alcyoniella australis]